MSQAAGFSVIETQTDEGDNLALIGFRDGGGRLLGLVGLPGDPDWRDALAATNQITIAMRFRRRTIPRSI